MSNSSHPKGKILIADRTSKMHCRLSDALSQAGYIVQMVESRDVLSVAQAFLPHLVLLDVQHTPPAASAAAAAAATEADSVHSAYQICQYLKTNPITCDIAVIFMGNHHEDVDQAFETGGADYIIKPFGLREILARIDNQITMQRLKKQLVQHQAQRMMDFSGASPLLAHLQKRLNKQARLLQEKNLRLQQEIQERQQAEEALRAEQKKSERLLLNILPHAIADQLKQDQASLAERFDHVTILFADIVDFTPLAARLSPLEVVSLLNHIFSNFDRLTEQYGLEKIKTIGDAYMVAGGVPIPRDDHAIAVMEMAIAMRQAIRQVNQETGYRLKLRIGINTGTVVAGVIGLRKFSYDLWGDAVNVASRMESHGLPNRIQVTEATYHLLQHRYHFEKWGKVNVKGKGRMTTYLYVGRRDDVES
jgi:class 3 adenylate cyclase